MWEIGFAMSRAVKYAIPDKGTYKFAIRYILMVYADYRAFNALLKPEEPPPM
jgi:hypothetical protein